MIKDWRSRLNKRVGEAIFLSAQRDYVSGDLQRASPVVWIANAIATLVLATPILMIVAGLSIAYIGFPNILALLFAVILIGTGWWLFPRRAKLPPGCFERLDMPATFEMLDQVSAALNGPKITRLMLIDDFNAAVFAARGERVLAIGALLWAALKDEQKIAVIAHEIGHLVNNDPTRGGFVGAGLATLEGWHSMFSQTVATNEYGEVVLDSSTNIIGDLIADSMRIVVELVWSLLARLNHLPQQRAEYLADALSAEVAGPAACISTLEQIELADRIGLQVARLGIHNLPHGMEMIDHLVQPIITATEEDRQAIRDQLRSADYAVDAVHPPSAFRIAFIDLLPIETGKIVPSDVVFSAINAELEPQFTSIGTHIAQCLTMQ